MYNSDGYGKYGSNAMVLELLEGDVIYMRLPSEHVLYDNSNNYSTFTGFLLFPM